MIHIIDLNFQVEGTIASFLIETIEGPVLVETGPHSTYPQLKKGIEACGFQTSDIRHVFLTHIHFDHAGAAWDFARQGATVYVHPVGYPHLMDPSRLYGSAKRIYGDMMETLWGAMESIPEERLVAVEDKASFNIGGKTFVAHHTPGHANHHIAWQLVDDLASDLRSIVFTGDVAGCKIKPGPVVPPCPPPDIDLEKWRDSITILRNLEVTALYLTHFGIINDIENHLDELEAILTDWGDWMKDKFDKAMTNEEVTPLFKDYAANQLREAGLNDHQIVQYEAANPAWMSVAGLMRYWAKR